MIPTLSFPTLEQMQTPIFICNAQGVVIFKNAAAMRRIRLPRRNTSVRSHLRQAEVGELERIPQRRAPSILTLHSGDRPMRALVIPYTKDVDCGPALAGTDAPMGECCSLWIFPAILQCFSTSTAAQYMEGVLVDLSDEVCSLIKLADRASGLLPGKPKNAIQQKLERRVNRILSSIEALPDGRWFDLQQAVSMLWPILHRRLEFMGVDAELTIEEDLYQVGQAVDLPRMSMMLLHLLSYCVPLADDRSVALCLCRSGESLCICSSFTLHWPPYTMCDSPDMSKLSLLLPSGQLELMVLEALGKNFNQPIRFTLTDESYYNLTLTLPLPVVERRLVRMPLLSSTELLFLEKDLEMLFGAVWEEKFTTYEQLTE